MRRVLLPFMALCLGIGASSWLMGQEPTKVPPPKHSIKEVMKQAHGESKLLKKVVDGQATKEEKDQLLDLYISLIDNKPAKGEPGKWMMSSGRLILAAARATVGRDGATEELKTASNCKACHDTFK